MEWGMAAAAGERVDIAGDGAFAAPTGATCWMVPLLLLYLGDRQTCGFNWLLYGCVSSEVGCKNRQHVVKM